MLSFATIFLFFIIYSFCGWLWEVVYFAVAERRFSNGGVINAPLLPIYGIGAILIILLVAPYIHNPFYVFLASVITASAVEFIGHWLLEKIFAVHLWNYSNLPFNLQGRICLGNSIGFGILSLALIYVVHPFITELLTLLPAFWVIVISSALAILFVFDFANSMRSMTKLRLSPEFIASLDEARASIENSLERARELRRQSRQNITNAKIVGLKLHKMTIKHLNKRFPDAELLPRKRKTKK